MDKGFRIIFGLLIWVTVACEEESQVIVYDNLFFPLAINYSRSYELEILNLQDSSWSQALIKDSVTKVETGLSGNSLYTITRYECVSDLWKEMENYRIEIQGDQYLYNRNGVLRLWFPFPLTEGKQWDSFTYSDDHYPFVVLAFDELPDSLRNDYPDILTISGDNLSIGSATHPRLMENYVFKKGMGPLYFSEAELEYENNGTRAIGGYVKYYRLINQ